MTILTANLKHLYQRRGVWFWYVYLLIFGPMFIKMGLRGERYLFCLMVSYFFGLMVGSIHKEILSKPFSFCLPAHSEIPRRLFLWVGVVVNGLLGCIFMFYPGLEFPSVFLSVLAGGVVGLTVYLLSAGMMLYYSNRGNISWLLILLAFAAVFLKWDIIVQEMIVTSPLIVIGLGSFLCWLVWKRIDIESLKRKSCGKIAMTLFDGYNKEKAAKYKLARLAEKDKKKPDSVRISSGVEGFFVSRIARAETGSLQQYIWGSLYKSFGIVFSQRRQGWMGFLIIILPALCLLCYMSGNMRNIIFIAPGMMVLHVSLWVHSSLSVSGGRRERFWSALILAAATGIFVTAAAVLLATVTNLVENIMPSLTIKGYEYTFSAVDMKFSLVPLLMIPVTFTIGLICYKKPMLKVIFVVVLFQVLFAMSFVSKLTIFNWRVQIGPEHLIIMLLFCWALFVVVLRYISMRCCLVTQTK